MKQIMPVFISAGHSNVAGKDRGAASSDGKYIEGVIVAKYREKLVKKLRSIGVVVTVDDNDSILSHTLAFFRNKTTKNSIVIDIHTNASGNIKATGTENLVPNDATETELLLAKELVDAQSEILGIQLRGNFKGFKGVRSESESHHGRLGWMRLTGENILLELFFISNPNDVSSFITNEDKLVERQANIIKNWAFGLNTEVEKTEVKNTDLTYTIVRGDTLTSIARKHGTTVSELVRLNNMTSQTIIKVGQKLRIK
jgi:N-acetylmuramoyl-L-alanine amidase